MSTTTSNKRKKAVAATVAAAALLLGGTFAWTSISQTALNEAIVDINPGGRLHDDFNGSTKAVYVENFAEEKDGVPIFARIKLTEYMEIGQQAGDKTLEDGARKANVVGSTVEDSLDAQALKAEPDTWNTYLPGEDSIDSENAYSEYWTLNWGNTSTDYHYMPTFNKNKDSLEADINGTYEGTVEGDIVHYDNYIDYNADTPALTKDAVYDWDDNTIDEVELGTATETRDETSPRDSANILLKEEEHSVKTLDATAEVITMAAWQALSDDEKAAQGYWVYDTDGWAYWSKPIEPGQTTGMFLNSIQMHKVPDDNWYYGLNVIGQFATKADISGFTSKGDSISDDALDLLSQITGIGMSYTIDGPSQVKPGNTYDYTTVLKNAGTLMEETPVETWTVSGDDTTGITMDGGTLTVSEDVEVDTTFTITVEAALEDGRTLTAEKAVTVGEAGPQVKKFLTVKKAGNDDAAAFADGDTIFVNPGEAYTLGSTGKTVTWSGDYITDTELTVPADLESKTTWTVTATDAKGNEYKLNFLCGPLYDETETFIYNQGADNESEETAVQFMVVADMIGNDGNPYGEAMSMTYWTDRYLPDGAEYYLTKTYNDVTQIVDRSLYGMSDMEVLEGGEIRDGFAILLYIEPDTVNGTKYDFHITYEKDGAAYGHTASYTYADNTDGSITAGGNVTMTETPAAYTKDDALAITIEDDAAGIAKYVTIDKTDAEVEPEYTVSVTAKDGNGDSAPISECYFGTASENGQIKTYGFLHNKLTGYITENEGGGYTKTYPTITYTVTVTYTGTDGTVYGNEATASIGRD